LQIDLVKFVGVHSAISAGSILITLGGGWVVGAFRTFKDAGWIRKIAIALILLLAWLVLDSGVRLGVTLNFSFE